MINGGKVLLETILQQHCVDGTGNIALFKNPSLNLNLQPTPLSGLYGLVMGKLPIKKNNL